jgi:hypothetical protein
MAYQLFEDALWGDDTQARVDRDVAPAISSLGLLGTLRLPLDIVFHPERFGSASDAGPVALATVMIVLGLPIVLRMLPGRPESRRLADSASCFLLLATIGWLLTSTTVRFFAPALALALVAVSGGLLRLGGVLARTVFIGVMLVAGGWGTWRFIGQHEAVFSSFGVVTGHESAEQYLTRRLEHYPAARFVRDNLPSDSKLLFIGETRPYYFNRAAVAPSAYDRHPLYGWVMTSVSVNALAARLKSEGITHVVLNVREFKRLRESYGLLRFSGQRAEEDEQRLRQLPGQLRTLFVQHDVYVLEVPFQRSVDAQKVGRRT